MSSTLRRLSPVSLALVGLLSAPPAAFAQGAGDPILEANGVKYACAGVGKASRGDPRWASFPVRLEFAAANGDFLGDPAVTVTDGTGKPVFQAQCNGPWVLIELPAGSYKVHATGQKAQYAKDFDLAVKAGGQTKKTIRLP
jgi:hypothetical protein